MHRIATIGVIVTGLVVQACANPATYGPGNGRDKEHSRLSIDEARRVATKCLRSSHADRLHLDSPAMIYDTHTNLWHAYFLCDDRRYEIEVIVDDDTSHCRSMATTDLTNR
jgi:hypothetical protein